MKNVLVVNICETYPTGRFVVDCARSSWIVDEDKAPFIDTVVGVYQNSVRVVIKGCKLVPATPEVCGELWDEGCNGRFYVSGGKPYHEKQFTTVRAECPQVYQPLASCRGIRYLTQEQFNKIPEGITLK